MINTRHPDRPGRHHASGTDVTPDLYRDWTAHAYDWTVGDVTVRVPVAQWSRGPRHAAR